MEGFMTGLIWQSEFLMWLFVVVFSSFLIWALFWGCAMVRKFLLWREREADNEIGKGRE